MATSTNIRVLIVDDSQTERFWEEKVLKGLGCETYTAEDGTAALRFMFQKQTVDLIMLDLKMPRMDGHEFLSEIRKNSDFDRVKVIVLSAKDEDEVIPVLAEGATDYWLKGSSVAVLKSRIRNIVYTISLERKLARVQEALES